MIEPLWRTSTRPARIASDENASVSTQASFGWGMLYFVRKFNFFPVVAFVEHNTLSIHLPETIRLD
jgi:hypothetical protein